MRRSTLTVVCMASVVGFGLFQLKYEVMKLENQYKQTHRAIKTSKEAISVLNAEWSHLVSPERLQQLAEKHLAIEPVSGNQLVSWPQIAGESSGEEADTLQNQMVLDQLVSSVLSNDD